MKEETISSSPSWVAEMTRTYDPAYSYVVIEHHLKAEDDAGFQKVDDSLSALRKEIIDRELVRDPSTGEQRLVIKMKRREAEEIMLIFLGAGLKEHYRCYIY